MRTFGIGPGREIGIIKDAIREAIMDGHIANERNAAIEFMERKGREMELSIVEHLTS